MACEINFYQYDDHLIRSLAPIIIKILDENKKVLILCQDDNQAKTLDTELWTYAKNKFIPHANATNKDFDATLQPSLLTTKEENQNEADYLIFLKEANIDFINKFSRGFYFYDQQNASLASQLVDNLKPKNIFKKENGKWVK